ncbi:pyridoxal phosphate-dependent decarboxylase family protein [Bernardetia sp.]|uniref:pyridoxal phosphate-dependent decarboxylase family protein n=1 Tax=Bernardetia sp. TaxID=1937974 RepID=UPI0025BE57FA|nr:aminotransferase class I/II-fold pyridoxal phosphate-dependent enzyme [Bernardetia sp.]
MLQRENFREYAHKVADKMADYLENVEDFEVLSKVEPRQIFDELPVSAPKEGESMDVILKDFDDIIMKGMTHWQNPQFFGYFPANSSPASVLGEMLTATLGAQCMIWQTSPAAAELEEKTMIWLAEWCGLPKDWHGVIQDTASAGTLCSLLTAREKATNFESNTKGLAFFNKKFRTYCSDQTHSSIDKAVRIAGIGSDNLIKIKTDSNFAIDINAFEEQVKQDIQDGFTPLWAVANLGTTSSTAFDNVVEMAEVCSKYGIWLHIDAAYAGTAAILPEKRYLFEGIELGDSYVFNPHKWMFVNFDCSAYYVKDKVALIRTFEILPEYLKTGFESKVNNYRDWGVALGRRFRALKLWFVMRNFGLDGIQEKLRLHLSLADYFTQKIISHQNFELITNPELGLVCFRYFDEDKSAEELDKINEQILKSLNQTGKVFLSHTKLNGKYVLRLSIGQTYVEKKHIDNFWELLLSVSSEQLSVLK